MGGDHINRFNTATLLCLFQAKTCISNVLCRGLICVFIELSWELIVRFVDNGGFVDHHRLNFLFIISIQVDRYSM
jgi:hypothetical protein